MASKKSGILSLVIIAGLFLAIVVAGLIGSMKNGNYAVLGIVFTAISVCILAVMLSAYRTRLMLKDRTPDRIIDHYHRSVRRIPHANAAAAYLSALAAAFFGQYDRARTELDAVDWDATTPVYRGHRLYALAILALMEETDYPKALALAAQARDLESRGPGGGLEAIDDIVRLVAGAPDPETVKRLEKIAQKHGLVPAMSAWALALHYRREGQLDKAADFKETVRMSVPFSAPLNKA